MFKTLFDFLLNRKGHPAPEAPYKVEVTAVADTPVVVPQPEAVKCGCGRSQSGNCVGLHKLTPEEWSVHADNPNKAPAKKARAPKKSSRKKAGSYESTGQA